MLEGKLKEWKVCVFNEGDSVWWAERKGSEEVEEDPRGRCAEQAKSRRPGHSGPEELTPGGLCSLQLHGLVQEELPLEVSEGKLEGFRGPCACLPQ